MRADVKRMETLELCAGLDMRVPSVGEAQELAQTHDLPNVGATAVDLAGL